MNEARLIFKHDVQVVLTTCSIEPEPQEGIYSLSVLQDNAL